MTGKIFSPLLLLLAKLTESELLHTIQFPGQRTRCSDPDCQGP